MLRGSELMYMRSSNSSVPLGNIQLAGAAVHAHDGGETRYASAGGRNGIELRPHPALAGNHRHDRYILTATTPELQVQNCSSLKQRMI